MKNRSKKNNKGKTLFLCCIGAFLLVVYGAAPLVFPKAVQPLETIGLLAAAFVLWLRSMRWGFLRRPWLLFSAVASVGAAVSMFYEELGAAVVGGLNFVFCAVVFLAAGSYLVRGRLADTRTLADTGISMLAVLSLSYPYLIQPQLAGQGFDKSALLLVPYLVVLLDIAVTMAILFFSSRRALLPPANLLLGLGLALECLHFIFRLSEEFSPPVPGTMMFFLLGVLLIATASCCPVPASGHRKITSSVFKSLAGRRLWERFCQLLPDMLVFLLFILLGVHYEIGGVMFTGAMLAVCSLWLRHFAVIHTDEKRLKRAMKNRRELRLQNDELMQKSSMAALDASLDFLTQLYNRRYIDRAITRPKEAPDGRIRLGLMLIDVDYFKQVNDTLGHQTGDMVLREVADGIRMAAGSCHIGGRYGGDEFILLLHDVTADDMQLIADRLLSYVRSTLSYIPVTLSIGGALYEGDITGYDSEVLTKEADTALYKSKENGRDRYTGVSNEKTG